MSCAHLQHVDTCSCSCLFSASSCTNCVQTRISLAALQQRNAHKKWQHANRGIDQTLEANLDGKYVMKYRSRRVLRPEV